MNYYKKQAMKKKILAGVALIMAIIMILSLIAPFTIFAAPVAETTTVETPNKSEEVQVDETVDSLKSFGKDRFTVELNTGFEESYIVKKAMPVRGVITNHGDAFHGEVQIKAYTRVASSNKEYSIYYQKLDLEQGASKSINMEATMGNIHEYLEITLVDSKGTTVYQDYVFLEAKDPDTVMVGVLSENPQDLKYFNNLHLAKLEDDSNEYSTDLSKNYDFTVFLDENTFPNSIGVLNSFSVLVVDDFDFSVFDDYQRDAIQQWILGGGTLVIGTGAAAQKTLKGLHFLSDIKIEGTTTISGLQDITGEIPLVKLSGKSVQELKTENGNKLLSVIEMGQGQVVISHFSLSAAPMAGQNATLNMLQEVLHEVADESLNVNFHDGRNYDRLLYIAGDFPAFEESSVILILGTIVIYIIVTGPILYFILKKKDKREKGWVLVPLLSFLFMGLVFVLAQNSTYKNGIINTVGAVEMQEGSSIAKADMGIALKSSGKGDVIFTSEEKMPISLDMDDYHNRDNPEKEKCAYRILCGDTTEITFADSSSWGTQYFRTQNSVDLGGNVESTVVMKDGRFVGQIINHTNVDFYRVLLLLNGYYMEFDALAGGETLEVDISMEELTKEDERFGDYNYDEIRSAVNNGEISRRDAYLRYIEEDIQQEFYEYEENIDLIPVTFFGFSESPVFQGEKKVNGKKVLENNIVMYFQRFPVELSSLKEFEIPLEGAIYASVDFNQYDNGYGDIIDAFEDGDFNLEYATPTGVRIDELKFEMGMNSDKYIPEFIKIYNRKNQVWDEVALGQPMHAHDYIDENNLVEVVIHCLQDKETKVPKLFIKGGGLFAGN